MLPILCFPFKTLMVLCVKLQSETMLPILCVPFTLLKVLGVKLQSKTMLPILCVPFKTMMILCVKLQSETMLPILCVPFKTLMILGIKLQSETMLPVIFCLFFSWYFTASMWKTWWPFCGKATAAVRAVLPIPTGVRSISSVQTMVWLPVFRISNRLRFWLEEGCGKPVLGVWVCSCLPQRVDRLHSERGAIVVVLAQYWGTGAESYVVTGKYSPSFL